MNCDDDEDEEENEAPVNKFKRNLAIFENSLGAFNCKVSGNKESEELVEKTTTNGFRRMGNFSFLLRHGCPNCLELYLVLWHLYLVFLVL